MAGKNAALVQLAVNALRQGDHMGFICASEESARQFRSDVEAEVGPTLASGLQVVWDNHAPPDTAYLSPFPAK